MSAASPDAAVVDARGEPAMRTAATPVGEAPTAKEETRLRAAPRGQPVSPPDQSGIAGGGRKRLRHGAIALLAIVLAAAGAIIADQWWTVWRFIVTTDNAYMQADAAVVASRVEGYIRELRVEDNSPVRRNDVLVALDDADYQARVRQAAAVVQSQRAKVAADEAAIAILEAQSTQQQSIIAQMRGDVAAADAEVERAQQDFKRYEALATSNTASVQKLETATSDYRKATAVQSRARASHESEQRRVLVLQTTRQQADARLKQSQADLAESEAALALARINLEYTVIHARIDGVVGNRTARVGQYVRPGLQLLTIVPRQPYITANFKETQLTNVRVGQSVSIAIDAYPDIRLEGHVESFAPATGAQFSVLPPENATGNFTKVVQRVPVRIAIHEPGPWLDRLRSGLSVIVSVDTRSPAAAAAAAPGTPTGSPANPVAR